MLTEPAYTSEIAPQQRQLLEDVVATGRVCGTGNPEAIQWALDEIDRLRAEVANLFDEWGHLRASAAPASANPYRHDHNPLNTDIHGGICSACEWERDETAGTGWDDAIDVEPVALPSTHEVPSMTAHGSVVHHRSERGVWCRESRVFLGSDYDLSLHRCSAAADHQSADWSCTIKLVDLEVQP